MISRSKTRNASPLGCLAPCRPSVWPKCTEHLPKPDSAQCGKCEPNSTSLSDSYPGCGHCLFRRRSYPFRQRNPDHHISGISRSPACLSSQYRSHSLCCPRASRKACYNGHVRDIVYEPELCCGNHRSYTDLLAFSNR